MAKYRVKPGHGINFGDTRADEGDVVELTPVQADAFRDDVDRVAEPKAQKKVAGGSELPSR